MLGYDEIFLIYFIIHDFNTKYRYKCGVIPTKLENEKMKERLRSRKY